METLYAKYDNGDEICWGFECKCKYQGKCDICPELTEYGREEKMNKQQIEKQFPTLTWHFERSHGFEEMLETAINKMDIRTLLELGRNYENFRNYYYKLMNEWERS